MMVASFSRRLIYILQVQSPIICEKVPLDLPLWELMVSPYLRVETLVSLSAESHYPPRLITTSMHIKCAFH